MSSKKKVDKKTLTMRSTVKTLSIKCYDEQLALGWEHVQDLIKKIPKENHVIAIKHDKDYNLDNIWLPSTEKPHYHIIWRTTQKTPWHVSTVLNTLGIYYRPDIDDTLWRNHGVETIRDFGSMAMYLTHETEQAELDGKTWYPIEELVSNLTLDEIKQVREGYKRLSEQCKKVSIDELSELDELAYQMGYELKDFRLWYKSLPFTIRTNIKMRTIQESYNFGVEDRVELDGEVNRLSVFIHGGNNMGKTHAAKQALKGKKTLKLNGGGTGKFDKLTPTTEAIIIDDYTSPNLLNMADNYMCQAYRRTSNNPYWCGRYFIVTSNLTFRQWLEKCGIETTTGEYDPVTHIEKDSEHFRAMCSRFYICHIEEIDGINRLICTSPSTRGTEEQQLERMDMYIEFRDKFNQSMAEFVPPAKKLDHSKLNDYKIL